MFFSAMQAHDNTSISNILYITYTTFAQTPENIYMTGDFFMQVAPIKISLASYRNVT
jgi:hypothetical protein